MTAKKLGYYYVYTEAHHIPILQNIMCMHFYSSKNVVFHASLPFVFISKSSIIRSTRGTQSLQFNGNHFRYDESMLKDYYTSQRKKN
jgi:hypothetical protein